MQKFILIIVFIFSALLAVIFLADTRQFVYSFLSDAYYLHLYSLALLVLFGFERIFGDKTNVGFSNYQSVLYWIWGAYILLYSIFSHSHEAYFQSYLLANIVIVAVLSYFLREYRLTLSTIYIPIALLGISQSIIAILQYLHILASHSVYFRATGTMDNPNIAAMLICLSIPSWVELARIKRSLLYLSAFVLLMEMVSLILLQCRTALLGTIVITGIYAFLRINKTQGKKAYIRGVSIVVICVIVTGTFIFIQQKNKLRQTDVSLSGK